jgi:3-methylcrotonyl-CoA carboxylase alpha subunit
VTTLRLECGGREREVRLEEGAAFLDGRRVEFRAARREGRLAAIEIAGTIFPLRTARQGNRTFVACAGSAFEIRRSTAGVSRRGGAGPGDTHAGLVAPMPGRVRRALVRRGDPVRKGQVVLILEAMKMEHAIRAPQDGVVTSLEHGDGDLVEAGTVLAEIG